MTTLDDHIQNRLASALYRLTSLEERASSAESSPKVLGKLLGEIQKLAAELEHVCMDVRKAAVSCSALQSAAAAASRRAERLFDFSPTPSVLVNSKGTIVDANKPAVKVLNVSQRHLLGRPFQLFLGSDRETFLRRLEQLCQGDDPDRWPVTLRPRERSTLNATLAAAPDPSGLVLLMFLKADGEGDLDAANGAPPALGDLQLDPPRRMAKISPVAQGATAARR